MPLRLALCLAALVPFCSPSRCRAQASSTMAGEISLPVNLHLSWHETSERIEKRIEATKTMIVERRKIGSRWALIVSNFKKPNPPILPEVVRMIFYFGGGQLAKTKTKDGKVLERLADGELVEVEYQFQQQGWTEELYGEALSQKRRSLERDYGVGEQLVRSTTPTPDGQAAQTLVGYKWNKNNTSVEILYFHVVAKTGQQEFHTLSLHFKRS